MPEERAAGAAGASRRRAEAPFTVVGEIDIASAPRMAADLSTYCESTSGKVVVDCARMTFIDSSGLAVFETARRDLTAQGREIELTNVVDHCRRAFQIIGLADLLVDHE
ncbi:MAG TPA: STAS domain-containing protein [Acidimicrobiia bacterium]|jgi:anti-anti-sigma factor